MGSASTTQLRRWEKAKKRRPIARVPSYWQWRNLRHIHARQKLRAIRWRAFITWLHHSADQIRAASATVQEWSFGLPQATNDRGEIK